MFRAITKILVVLCLVAVLWNSVPAESQAHWWWGCHRGWGCGYGSYWGGWGGWGGYWGCGGWGWGCHRAWSSCYPCYTPCYTSCWPCGVSYGVVGVVGDACCGGVVGGTIVEPAQGPTLAPSMGVPTPAPVPGTVAPPALPQPPGQVPAPPAPAPKSSVELRADSALLTIWVPEDARVFVNGYQTKSTGNCRKYVSHGLKSGFSYRYEIRAVVERSGREVEEIHHTTLTAGGEQKVAFSFKATPERLAANW